MADSTEILLLNPEGGFMGSGVHLCQPCADLVEIPPAYSDGTVVARTAEQFLDILCPKCKPKAAMVLIFRGVEETHNRRHTDHLLRVMDEQD